MTEVADTTPRLPDGTPRFEEVSLEPREVRIKCGTFECEMAFLGRSGKVLIDGQPAVIRKMKFEWDVRSGSTLVLDIVPISSKWKKPDAGDR